MDKFRIVTAEGKTIKTTETYAGANMFWEYCNGIIEDENGKQHYIYIEEIE